MKLDSGSKHLLLSEISVRRPDHRVRTSLLLLAALACGVFTAHADDRKAQKRVPPVYPELAKRMHIGGMVHVSATVAADGSVTDAKAVSGNKLLTSAAEEAVRKWKFAPGDAQSTVDIDINFESN